MISEADRSNVRVVSLDDLEREFPRDGGHRARGADTGAPDAAGRLERALTAGASEPPRPPVIQSDWIGLPPISARTPHPIGSTLPGPLPEDEFPRPPVAKPSLAPLAKQPKPRPVRDVPRLPSGVVLQLPVRFDAVGTAYARIWLGNLLLLVLTLGLAWPWAYRRREQFFLRHTQVAGHRLDFRLSPKVMWPRVGMTMALCLGVAGAAAGSVWTGLAALTLGALVWPLLSYLKLNHRVASVMWAGRRFWFDGPWQGVYQSLFPSLMIAVAGVWLGAMAWQQHRPVWWWATAACWALWMVTAPLATWAYLSFRQKHLRLGPLQLIWKVTQRAVWRVVGRTLVWSSLVGLVLAGVGALVLAGSLMWARASGTHGVPWRVLQFSSALGTAVLLTLVWPYAQATLANLVWSKTGNRHLRFRSQIKVSAYVLLFAKNTLRVVLTLGLYWPWAVVNLRRRRTQSLQVWSRVEPEVLLAHWSSRQTEAAPEAVSPVSLSAEAPPTQPGWGNLHSIQR